MAIIVDFKFERETKRTFRFREVEQAQEPTAIGVLYVQKNAFDDPSQPPKSIRVMVEVL